MRKMALVKDLDSGIKRVIVHESKDGVYIFPCASLEDGSLIGDQWRESIEQADEACFEQFGITADDWQDIGDPLPHCQQDWIAPVRVKGRDVGKPQFGILERLENGEWKEFHRNEAVIATYSSL